ncbi:uncharacterized protein [Solanum lycopersicum]|uniref:uncharacterized protein n=1 Tax=Solanum lycopersicum TaxID=4081 RepID=UPI00374927BC
MSVVDENSAQEEKQEIDKGREQEIKQTSELNLSTHTGSKHLDFSLSNFPMLSAIPIRNGFESLRNSKLASLPVDRDRLAGVPVTLNDIRDFEECVKDMGITEVQWKGNYYTWSNKQIGNARIASRIDRASGNDTWMDKWGHAAMEYGNLGVSDHSPMHLLLHQSYHQIRVSFKFFNVWIEHDSFLELMDKVWKQKKGSEVMKEIWESALRQKARARWIKLGDANNKYFSSVIKERTQKKHIRSILSIDGRMLYEPQEIQEEFVMFYKSLMGSSASKLPSINAQVMKRGPVLSKQQRIQLCTDITEQEIDTALQSIGNDNALGIDGYNALFFKHTWKIIKKDVIEAVKSFFTTGKLFKPFNCTLVSLIPKVQSPKTVKEYMPIACCTVLYKIISKVITKIMHDVIHTVICDSQAGFIPGRKIADNIFLAHELVKAYTRKNISPRSMLKIDLQSL